MKLPGVPGIVISIRATSRGVNDSTLESASGALSAHFTSTFFQFQQRARRLPGVRVVVHPVIRQSGKTPIVCRANFAYGLRLAVHSLSASTVQQRLRQWLWTVTLRHPKTLNASTTLTMASI